MPSHLFIDASVFNRVIMQDSADNSIEHLKQIDKLQTEGKGKVLVPEITVLEVEKFKNRLATEIEVRLNPAIIAFQNTDFWNEIPDFKDDALAWLKDWQRTRQQLCSKRATTVSELIKKWGFIKLTPEILCEVQKRFISEKMPPQDGRKGQSSTFEKRSQDAGIIETLASVNKKRGTDDLLLCTFDRADFVDKETTDLHRVIKDALPNSFYCASLKDAFESINRHEPPPKREPVEVRLDTASSQIMSSLNQMVQAKRDRVAGEIFTLLPFVRTQPDLPRELLLYIDLDYGRLRILPLDTLLRVRMLINAFAASHGLTLGAPVFNETSL